MASSLIHMVVANEINKVVKKDKTKLLIGSIAPDISKIVGIEKKQSHFLIDDSDIPCLEKFLIKYQDKINDDFVLGYYIHLFTDYFWFKCFIPEIYKNGTMKKLNGTEVKCHGEMWGLYVYNDYEIINQKILDEYDIDLEIFYNEIPKIDNIITEIPMDELDKIVDNAGLLIKNSKPKKEFVFDMNNIKRFITLSVNLILPNVLELISKNDK